MSQNHGQQRGRRHGRQAGPQGRAPGGPSHGHVSTRIDPVPRQGRHTSFDRPSLFAQDAADDQADAQRVPLLSTLESMPGAGQGAYKARRGPTPYAHETPLPRRGGFGALTARWGDWQAKALMGLMVAGILSLMTAFVLLLLDRNAERDAKGPAAEASQERRPIPVDRRNPLAALVVPTSRPVMERPPSTTPPAIAPQAAVIEDLPHATLPAQHRDDIATSTALTIPAATDTSPLDANGGPRTLLLATAPSGAGLPPVQGQAIDASIAIVTAPRSDPAIDKAPDKAPLAPATRRQTKSGKDEDVALLEAVLAHSASRQPPAPALSVTEALRRCGELEGAASAICRARVCVGSPTAAACHQDP